MVLDKLLGKVSRASFMQQHFLRHPFALAGACRDWLHLGSWTTIERYSIQPVPGSNVITVRAGNYRSSSRDPFVNPAGIIFRADVSYET